MEDRKNEEQKAKEIKIKALSAIKEKQEKDRKERFKKNSEALRVAIESRKNTEVQSKGNLYYMSKQGSRVAGKSKNSGGLTINQKVVGNLNKDMDLLISENEDQEEQPENLLLEPVKQ